MELLAQETLEKSLWNPTILGVLVVVSGIILFCGSIYLLLGTNLGARVGFLVAFTGLMGFMVVLSLLWITTSSPLNTLKGRLPTWEAKEVVPSLDEAKTAAARDIVDKGEEVGATEAANVKAAVDETLVQPNEVQEHEGIEPSEFAVFPEVTDYMPLKTYEIGGSSPNPFDFEITHEPLVAVVQFCEVVEPDVPFGLPPPEPECDPASENQGFIILEYDLGSLRVPPIVAFVMFTVLFGLGLLALHWREKDEAAVKTTGPVPVPSGAST